MQRNLTTPEFEHLHKLAERLGMASEDRAARNLAEYAALLERSSSGPPPTSPTSSIRPASSLNSTWRHTFWPERTPVEIATTLS